MNRRSCPSGMPQQIDLDSEEQAQKHRSFCSYLNRSSQTGFKLSASKHLFGVIFQKSTSPQSFDDSSVTSFSLIALNQITQFATPETSQDSQPSQTDSEIINSPKSLSQNLGSQNGQNFKISVSNKQFFSQYSPIKIVHRSGLKQLFIIQSIRETKKKIMKMTFKVRFEQGNVIRGQSEIQNLSVLRHPGLPILTQIYEDCNKYMLVFDYIEGITLAEFLDTRDVTEQVGKIIIRQILEILSYIHGHSLVHGDIRPENIYISNYQKSPLDLKIHIIDLSKVAPPQHHAKKLQYMKEQNPFASPESVNGVFSTKYDIWSVGILVIALFSKIPNFTEKSQIFFESLKDKSQFSQTHLKNIPETVVSFINFILISRPMNRPCATQALQHNWLTNKELQASSGHRRHKCEPYIRLN